MRKSYHLVHILARYGGTEHVVSSHDTIEDAKSAYRSCGGPYMCPEHMVIRHMGLIVWDSEAARAVREGK